jgi:hypothetical protein
MGSRAAGAVYSREKKGKEKQAGPGKEVTTKRRQRIAMLLVLAQAENIVVGPPAHNIIAQSRVG